MLNYKKKYEKYKKKYLVEEEEQLNLQYVLCQVMK